MNYSIIFYIMGYVLKIEGFLLLAPAAVDLIYNEGHFLSFFIFAVVGILLGTVITVKKPKNQVFFAKEGFVCVALSWIVMSVFGCLPFVLNGDIPRFADAFFEIVSGFTTTGSTVLTDVEALSHASLFWRSFSHWIGGMGILVFLLSVLPLTGGATIHLMRAESPGPQVGKMVPRMKDTAIILYIIYTVMTLLEIVILICGKMQVFDAIVLSFGTAGTGGFTIKNSGVAEYSAFSQYVISIFMLLFGVNFNVYFFAIRRRFKEALSVEEKNWYFLIVAVAVAVITFNTFNTNSAFDTLEKAFRHSLFQVSSIITTTGYATVDFEALYPELSKLLLVLIMFCGACAGSTGGGIKVSRVVILAKSVRTEILRIIHPRAVRNIRFERKILDKDVVRSVYIFLAAYFAIFSFSIIIITIDGFDFTTNFTAVTSTINNIGPGLGKVGPYGNFSEYSDLSKYVLSFNMLAGRLEIFPILILFSSYTWKWSARAGKLKNLLK